MKTKFTEFSLLHSQGFQWLQGFANLYERTNTHKYVLLYREGNAQCKFKQLSKCVIMDYEHTYIHKCLQLRTHHTHLFYGRHTYSMYKNMVQYPHSPSIWVQYIHRNHKLSHVHTVYTWETTMLWSDSYRHTHRQLHKCLIRSMHTCTCHSILLQGVPWHAPTLKRSNCVEAGLGAVVSTWLTFINVCKQNNSK